jgi:ATP-citrate lyase beta-subunit
LLDQSREQLVGAVRDLQSKGYQWFIVEPMQAHESSDERYLSMTSDRKGLYLSFSRSGGIDIESHASSMQQVTIDESTDWNDLAEQTGFTVEQLQKLVEVFEGDYMVFLEINPYLTGDNPQLLDLAIEVDDAGAYFVNNWSEDDFRRSSNRALTPEEETVIELAEKSPASFKLEVINPDGGVFLLLSGGGASIVVADEVYNQGHGKQLANYGEYSGNPNTEEAEIYTSAVLSLLLKSKAERKVLFIGGAVANFTDIANTFAGVIAAIEKVADKLREQNVKVFVRRGGPRQEIGLAKIEACLRGHDILGAVHSPDTPLTEVVGSALQEIS